MMKGRRIQVLSVVALLLIGVAAAWALDVRSNAGAAQLDPALRTVVLLRPGEQAPALRGNDEAVQVEAGSVPNGIRLATVLTDKDCAADEQGVSHCLNDLQIGRAKLAVRHHHKMMEVPCFSPTEQLNVVDATTYSTLTATGS